MCDDEATAERKMHLILSMMKTERERNAMEITTLQIRALKAKLKKFAEIQHKTKLARKTTLPKDEWLALKNDLAPKSAYWDHSVAASDARLRKVEITACLNLYHELRGSSYRHGDEEGYWYKKYMEQLRSELANIKN